ncbi:MAG: glycosyltransferase family 9 protein [Oleiphilus sp.]
MLPSPIKHICILRLSAIGDVCHAVAAVQAIQATHPDAAITWIIGKIEYQLLKGLPGIEFVVFDKSQGKKAFTQLKIDLADKHFDVLLQMQVAFRANLATKIIPAKIKIGYDWHRAKELHTLFTNTRIKAQTQAHVLESFFAFAEKIGVPESAKHKLNWHIPVSDQDQGFAEKYIPEGQPCFIIAPSASNAERNWTVEGYAALAKYAEQKGFKSLLCGGPSSAEKNLAENIVSECGPNLINLTGQTSLKQMLALLKRASLVLAPDTGPAHMAVTQGTPVIGLYAHSNPKRTGPYLYQDYVVEVYHKNLLKRFHKKDSQLPWGTRLKGKALMQEISIQAVIDKFDQACSDFELVSLDSETIDNKE